MKKLFSIILVIVLLASFVGCDGNESTNEASEGNETTTPTSEDATEDTSEDQETNEVESVIYPEETILIAVEIYDPTESETLEMQKYFEYLSEHFNVEFKYSEAIKDAEQELKFIEDSAVAGAKAFFGYYNITDAQQVEKVIEYGMYFFGGDPDLHELYKDEPLYLGRVTGNGSDYDNGYALGTWVMDNELTNVIYANGGANFGVQQFVERQAGFLDAIDENVQVTTVSGFPGEQFFADQASALSVDGVQAVVASFNGVDFWAQPISSAGLTEVKLATIGAINDAYLNAFETGALDYLVAGNIQSQGFAVPMLLNAIDGNAEALKRDGKPTAYAAPNFRISSAEECRKILEIQNTDKIYHADELMELIVQFNPEANADTLEALIEAVHVD